MVCKISEILDLKIGTLYQLTLKTLETLKNLGGELRVWLLKIVIVSYVLIKSITLGILFEERNRGLDVYSTKTNPKNKIEHWWIRKNLMAKR